MSFFFQGTAGRKGRLFFTTPDSTPSLPYTSMPSSSSSSSSTSHSSTKSDSPSVQLSSSSVTATRIAEFPLTPLSSLSASSTPICYSHSPLSARQASPTSPPCSISLTISSTLLSDISQNEKLDEDVTSGQDHLEEITKRKYECCNSIIPECSPLENQQVCTENQVNHATEDHSIKELESQDAKMTNANDRDTQQGKLFQESDRNKRKKLQMEPLRKAITPILTPIPLQCPVLKLKPDGHHNDPKTAASKAKYKQLGLSGSKRASTALKKKQRDSYSDSKQKPQRRRHATASQKADELSFSLIQEKLAEYEKESKTIKHQLTSEKDKIQSMRTRTSMQKNRLFHHTTTIAERIHELRKTHLDV